VEDLCYLGSWLSTNGNCDKDCQIRIGKANSVFRRLQDVWRNKHISRAHDFPRQKNAVLRGRVLHFPRRSAAQLNFSIRMLFWRYFYGYGIFHVAHSSMIVFEAMTSTSASLVEIDS